MLKAVHSRPFVPGVAALIACNAAVIGVQADLSMQEPSANTVESYQVTEGLFTLVFAVELILRLYAERIIFFKPTDPSFMWNLVDLVIVVTGIVAEFLDAFLSVGLDVTAIRLLRTLKAAKVFCVSRMLRFC